MSALPEAAHSLNETVAANSFAIGIKTRRFEPAMTGTLTAETVEMLETAAAVLTKLDDLRELAMGYGKELRIERSDRYFWTEPEWWDIGRRVLDGEVLRRSLYWQKVRKAISLSRMRR
jgi:hypothetical protein